MGWRAQDAWDRLERENYRAWWAEQPLGRRIALRIGQAVRLAIAIGLFAVMASVSWPL